MQKCKQPLKIPEGVLNANLSYLTLKKR